MYFLKHLDDLSKIAQRFLKLQHVTGFGMGDLQQVLLNVLRNVVLRIRLAEFLDERDEMCAVAEFFADAERELV
jgi:hypothetical protein